MSNNKLTVKWFPFPDGGGLTVRHDGNLIHVETVDRYGKCSSTSMDRTDAQELIDALTAAIKVVCPDV